MILRVIRGRGSDEEILALDAALKVDPGVPRGDRGGPERFHVGWREGEGRDRVVVVISRWGSPEAVANGDAAGTSPYSLARRHLRDVDVAHFEVDGTIERRSATQPVALRIGTGRFSRPGADSEMQDLLRQRAPLIGDEMTEAWVGRRLIGREVEVTFVSAWARPPADHALDAAFWPDIALRYDQFVVEVYAVVGVEWSR